MAPKKTQSDAPVAAREQLDQVNEPGGSNDQLEQQAADQEKRQAEQLDSSLSGAGANAAQKLQEQASDVPALARAGVERQTATQGGFVDQLSRRSANDALEGHFVSIDLNNKDVQAAYKSVGLEDHTGAYGVYLEPLGLNPDTGIPETALVRLRDATNARVQLPYEALSPAESGGR